MTYVPFQPRKLKSSGFAQPRGFWTLLAGIVLGLAGAWDLAAQVTVTDTAKVGGSIHTNGNQGATEYYGSGDDDNFEEYGIMGFNAASKGLQFAPSTFGGILSDITSITYTLTVNDRTFSDGTQVQFFLTTDAFDDDYSSLTFASGVDAITGIDPAQYTNAPVSLGTYNLSADMGTLAGGATEVFNLSPPAAAKTALINAINSGAEFNISIHAVNVADDLTFSGVGNTFDPGAPELSITATLSSVVPVLSVSKTELDPMSAPLDFPSVPQTYELEGTNLIPLASDVTVTPPTGFEVSSDGINYSTSLTLPYTDGALAPTTISVRVAAASTANFFEGTIVNSGGGASLSPEVSVSGGAGIFEACISAGNKSSTVNVTGEGVDFPYTAGGSNAPFHQYSIASFEITPADFGGTVTALSEIRLELAYDFSADSTAGNVKILFTTDGTDELSSGAGDFYDNLFLDDVTAPPTGVDPAQFTSAPVEVASIDFDPAGKLSGQIDVYELTLDSATETALIAAINAGEEVSVIIAPGDDDVFATYAGFDNFEGPPPVLCVRAELSQDPSLATSESALSEFRTSPGSASAAQSYTLDGFNLTPDAGSITVTPPSGYEVSLDGTSFASSESIAYTGGAISGETVFVRLNASAPNGRLLGDITHSGGGLAFGFPVALQGLVGLSQVSLPFTEDFETDGENTTYLSDNVANGPGDLGNFDLFGRFLGFDLTEPLYSGWNGDYLVAAQDIPADDLLDVDPVESSADGVGRVYFAPIDVTGEVAISVSMLAGAASSFENGGFYNWEDDDKLTVDYRLDGGAWTPLAAFVSDLAGGGSGDLLEDTDLDGTADGTRLGAALQDFSWPLLTQGSSTLEVRVTAESDGGFEGMAFDDLRVAASQPFMELSATSATVAEGSGAVQIDIQLSVPAPGGGVTLTITEDDSDDSEVSLGGTTVAIGGGSSSGSFTITPLTDGLCDGDQIVTLTASGPGFEDATFVVTIENADPPSLQALPFSESFETDEEGCRFLTEGRADLPADVNTFDYFGLIDPFSLTSPLYFDSDGFQVLAGSDIQDQGQGDGVGRFTTAPIDVSSTATVAVSLLAAADNADENGGFFNYEPGDGIAVDYRFDGGAWTPLGAFANNGDSSSDLFEDVDGDGVGEGTKLTTQFQSFQWFAATGGASQLEVRITMNANAGFEAMAVDLLEVSASSPFISVAPAVDSLAEGSGAATYTITLSQPAPVGGVSVSVVSDDASEVSLSGLPVTISEGQTVGAFTVTPLDDGICDPSQDVMLTASATGYESGEAEVTVTNTNPPPLQSLPYEQRFETDEEGCGYITSGLANSDLNRATFDYFGVLDSFQITSPVYFTTDGFFIFAASDIPDSGQPEGDGAGSVQFAPIDVDGVSQVSVSILAGADNSGENGGFTNFEPGDGLTVEYQFDGGSWAPLAAFKNDGQAESDLSEDTNLDGVGDGTPLTSALADFSWNLTVPGGAQELNLRVSIVSDDAFEAIAFDHLRVAESSALSPYETWAASLTPPLDTGLATGAFDYVIPGTGGITNGEVWAFNLDAVNPDRAGLPKPVESGGEVLFEFELRKDAEAFLDIELSTTLQEGMDPGDWFEGVENSDWEYAAKVDQGDYFDVQIRVLNPDPSVEAGIFARWSVAEP